MQIATDELSDAVHERVLSLRTTDSYTLGATVYEPQVAEPLANVLMIGAVGVPQRFYASFARYVARAGYRMLTFDYRGLGRSRPQTLRGFDAQLSDWAERDYPAALHWLLDHHAEVSTFAVGHSLGGQTVALTPRSQALRGVVTVASQNGYYGNFAQPWRMQLLWRVLLPSITKTFGYLPGWSGSGEDLPNGVAREWASWCLSSEYYLTSHPEYRAPLAAFDKPILAYSFDDDPYAPLINVRWLHARYERAALEHRHLDPRELGLARVGHFGFFRRNAKALWAESIAFFADCLGGAKSPRTYPRAQSQSTPSAELWNEQALREELEYGRN
jgi:predicted alpha/beta hydrolase